MPVAIFNPTLFKARYPQFADVSDGTLGAYFLEAGLYLNNTDCSRVKNLTKRLVLLNMLVAHIAILNGALSADGQALPVGRVSQAAEGSVSATLEYKAPATATEAWFDQTPFGAAFWAATAYLRSMVYSPRPTRWR